MGEEGGWARWKEDSVASGVDAFNGPKWNQGSRQACLCPPTLAPVPGASAAVANDNPPPMVPVEAEWTEKSGEQSDSRGRLAASLILAFRWLIGAFVRKATQ